MSRNVSFIYDGTTDHPVMHIKHHEILVPSVVMITVTAIWAVRLLFDQQAAFKDASACAVVLLILNWQLCLQRLSQLPGEVSSLTLSTSFVVFVALATWRLRPLGISSHIEGNPSGEEVERPATDPLMIPCRTTHTRVFPVKHSFTYSYLYVGIPVGWAGRAGKILSADRLGREPYDDTLKTWFSVEAEDHLERGVHPGGLRGKLVDYLKSQDIQPEQYPRALLVTAPRFLGFSFNPVSFWYLYDGNDQLGAMILEVNNTFDERRMYFMERPASNPSLTQHDESGFAHSWNKDFHVSPFNSRDGSYTLKAVDPYARTNAEIIKVDCTIVLKSADHKAKVVARVFSTEAALKASSMTQWSTLTFVSRWWWVGFMTNPRILREARSLWAKKLQIYYRPEVLKTSMGRQESTEEAQLEPSFQFLLHHLVEHSQRDLSITYIPAAGLSRGTAIIIGHDVKHKKEDEEEEGNRLTIEIRVLTPAFYSQFAKYESYTAAFEKLCFNAVESERHLFVSDHDSLSKLLIPTDEQQQTLPYTALPLHWRILSLVRSQATKPRGPTDGSTTNPFPTLTQLDLLTLHTAPTATRKAYCRSLTTLLLADRLALGFPPLLRLYGRLFWLGLVYVCVLSTTGALLSSDVESPPVTLGGSAALHCWAVIGWVLRA